MENALAVVILIFLVYYFILILFFVKRHPKNNLQTIKREFISVIVSVKNEANNINGLLTSLLNQNYPKEKYEIIIVDDHSSDSTQDIIRRESEYISHLKFFDNRNNPSKATGKKSAIAFGIANAQGEIILLTDADCRPGKEWANSIVSQFDSETSAVIGFSPFINKKSSLNTFIRFENFKSSFLMSVFYFLGLPYLSFGRNFAYRRSVFEMIRGFSDINRSLSGDDDLFLQRLMKNDQKIKLTTTRDSIVFSEPADSVKKYFRQKTRHLSASKYYPLKFKLLLGGFYIGNLLVAITFLVSLIFFRFDFLLITLPKFLFDVLSISYISKKISSGLTPIQIIICEFVYSFFYPIVGILSRKRNIRW